MSLNVGVNGIVECELFWYNTVATTHFQNRICHRVNSGTFADSELNASYWTQLETQILPEICAILQDDTYLHRAKVRALYPVMGIWWEKTYAPTDHVGQDGTVDTNNPPCASLAVTRKSYVPGRTGQSELYLGKLGVAFVANGKVDTTGGNLATLNTACAAPSKQLTLTGGAILKGAIVRPYDKNQSAPVVTSDNDVRTQRFGELVVYHQYRRPGMGS